MITFTNLDICPSFGALKSADRPNRAAVTPERIASCELPIAEGLRYNWSAKPVNDSIMAHLARLAREQQCLEKFGALASGEIMNTGEGRMVLHHAMRGRLMSDDQSAGRIPYAFYEGQHRRVSEFATGVRSGEIGTVSGKSFREVVQIGIGGSDLGPRALYLALENWAIGERVSPRLPAHFISNVDPDDALSVLKRLDLGRTLFILVSKSGTTQETLANEAFVIEALRRQGIGKPRQHIVAVTSQTSPMARSGFYRDAFFIDDYIGGRYSSTSAVGGVVLSLTFGGEVFGQLLEGAHAADRASLETDPLRNAALVDALIGVWDRNVMGYPTSAVLPYSQALSRFPAHLQQLDMESNGKSVNRSGEAISYPTGPVIFGEPGTNGQHSFYQLLHQGSDVIPLQFVGFRASQIDTDIAIDGIDNQTRLNANLAAQIMAFASGDSNDNLNQNFAGGRPASLIHGQRLTPRSLGALLAHFENKVMFQGFLWNINSFDQEGVQLGKRLAQRLLDGKSGEALTAYARLLGVEIPT